MALQVVTANRLDDGLAVFYGADHQWHASIQQAEIIQNSEDAEKILTLASDASNQLVVVGPYLIDVTQNNQEIVPVRYREVIRTLGPSVRPDLGYQANQ